MSDEASGHDSDDDQQELSVTDPGEPNADPKQDRGVDNWGAIDRTESTTQDGWTGTDDEQDDDEYRIPLDLSGDRDEERSDDPESDADKADSYEPEPSSTPIEPGDPDLESAIFVFLGAIAMAFVLFRVVSIPL